MNKLIYRGFKESNNDDKRKVIAGSNGTYNLQINNLNYDDVGIYLCQDQDLNTKGAHLSVIDNSGEPQSNYTGGPLLVNDVITTTCKAGYVADDFVMTVEATDGTTSDVKSGTVKDILTPTEVTSSIQQTAQRPKVPGVECRYVFKLADGVTVLPNLDTMPSIPYVTKVNEHIVWYCATGVKVDPKQARYLHNDQISCTAEGYPAPTVKWVDKATGETLVDGNVVRISRNALTNITYQYECVADNSETGFTCTAATELLRFMVYVIPYNVLMYLIPVILFLTALLLIAIGYVCCRVFAVGGPFKLRGRHTHKLPARYDSSILIDPTQHGHVVSRYQNLSEMTAKEMIENPAAYGSHTGMAVKSI